MKALPIAGPVVRPALDPLRRDALLETGYRRQPIGRGPRPVIRTDPAKISTRRIGKPAARTHATRRRSTLYATTAPILLLALAIGIGATESPRSLISQNEYLEARRGLDSEARLALATCRAVEGPEKGICRATARGEDRVRRAELEARYRGTVGAEVQIAEARARMRFEVAKAACLASVEDRTACLAAARAI